MLAIQIRNLIKSNNTLAFQYVTVENDETNKEDIVYDPFENKDYYLKTYELNLKRKEMNKKNKRRILKHKFKNNKPNPLNKEASQANSSEGTNNEKGPSSQNNSSSSRKGSASLSQTKEESNSMSDKLKDYQMAKKKVMYIDIVAAIFAMSGIILAIIEVFSPRKKSPLTFPLWTERNLHCEQKQKQHHWLRVKELRVFFHGGSFGNHCLSKLLLLHFGSHAAVHIIRFTLLENQILQDNAGGNAALPDSCAPRPELDFQMVEHGQAYLLLHQRLYQPPSGSKVSQKLA
jgi:hypothetical protein